MVIVQGWFHVALADREAFLAGQQRGMTLSRAEPGCQEYVLAADPLDAGRVILAERWESQAALDVHLATPRPAATGPAPMARSITFYDVSGERSLA
jgi:quinol monooxygenase YgiN